MGVKLAWPAVLTLTVPLATAMLCAKPGVSEVPAMAVTVRVLPSASVSLASRSIGLLVPFSSTVKLSGLATGASLTLVTVMATALLALRLPSEAVTVMS